MEIGIRSRCTPSRSSDLTELRTQSSWAGGGVWGWHARLHSRSSASRPGGRQSSLPATPSPDAPMLWAQGLKEAPDSCAIAPRTLRWICLPLLAQPVQPSSVWTGAE